MGGAISWQNAVFGPAASVHDADYGRGIAGADSAALATSTLGLGWAYDGGDGLLVRVEFSSSVTVRCVGLCGVTTESGAAPDVTFSVSGFMGGVPVFSQTGLALDASGATILGVLEGASTVNEIRVSADSSSAEGWISIGALWAGDALTLGVGGDCWLLQEWAPRPMGLDVRRFSADGQVYGRSGRRLRRWDLPLGFSVGTQALQRSGLTLAALEHEAGQTGPVVASLRGGNQSSLCLYGVVDELTEITRGPGDRFGKVVSIRETF